MAEVSPSMPDANASYNNLVYYAKKNPRQKFPKFVKNETLESLMSIEFNSFSTDSIVIEANFLKCTAYYNTHRISQKPTHIQCYEYHFDCFLSIYSGRLKMAGVLIENGANINFKYDDGSTPLHYAARHGNLS